METVWLIQKGFSDVLALLTTSWHSLPVAVCFHTPDLPQYCINQDKWILFKDMATFLLKESFHEIRNSVNKYSKELFENAKKSASTINVQPFMRRTCGIQRYRGNFPAADPQEYYERSLLFLTT